MYLQDYSRLKQTREYETAKNTVRGDTALHWLNVTKYTNNHISLK